MIRLPKLMLGDNLPQLIRIAAAITDEYSSVVECNTERLVTAEPVALCILAASFGQLESRGQLARVRGLRPEVRENLERLNVLADWLRESSSQTTAPSDSSHSVLRACGSREPGTGRTDRKCAEPRDRGLHSERRCPCNDRGRSGPDPISRRRTAAALPHYGIVG